MKNGYLADFAILVQSRNTLSTAQRRHLDPSSVAFHAQRLDRIGQISHHIAPHTVVFPDKDLQHPVGHGIRQGAGTFNSWVQKLLCTYLSNIMRATSKHGSLPIKENHLVSLIRGVETVHEPLPEGLEIHAGD